MPSLTKLYHGFKTLFARNRVSGLSKPSEKVKTFSSVTYYPEDSKSFKPKDIPVQPINSMIQAGSGFGSNLKPDIETGSDIDVEFQSFATLKSDNNSKKLDSETDDSFFSGVSILDHKSADSFYTSHEDYSVIYTDKEFLLKSETQSGSFDDHFINVFKNLDLFNLVRTNQALFNHLNNSTTVWL